MKNSHARRHLSRQLLASCSLAISLLISPLSSFAGAPPPPTPPPSIPPPTGIDPNNPPPADIDPAYAFSSWGGGRSDVFKKGPDGAVFHCVENGSPACRDSGNEGLFVEKTRVPNWENLGGVIIGSPAAVSWGAGRIDVFVRGTDNALWHKYFNGSWSGWESLGGYIMSSPTAASWGSGRLDVFAKGSDNSLVHIAYDGAWTGWESLGGVITSSPAAVSTAGNSIDVFARGTDNAMWHRAYNNYWYDWESLGGGFISSPAALKMNDGVVGVFAIGGGNTLYHRYKTNMWSNWTSLGGNWASAPAVVGRGGFSFKVLGDAYTPTGGTMPTVNAYLGASPYTTSNWSGSMPWHITGLHGTGGDTARIDMAWTPSTSVDSYDIFVQMYSGCIVLVWDPVAFGLNSPTYNVAGGSTSSYSANTVGYCRGSTYQMKIRYRKGGYYSDWSDWAFYTIP